MMNNGQAMDAAASMSMGPEKGEIWISINTDPFAILKIGGGSISDTQLKHVDGLT